MLLGGCAQVQPYSGTSPFEYREIHLPELKEEDAPQYLNSIDRDWGIWGHNLSVVLPAKPSPSVYAKEGISVNKEQFCFRGRNRRPPLDPVNAMLSFAYSLLASECTAALESVGLDAYVGFLQHDHAQAALTYATAY